MDPNYAEETLKHLEKEGELLLNAHKIMLDELHRCQIEEEMLMHKLYELMSAHGLTKEVPFWHYSRCVQVDSDITVTKKYRPIRLLVQSCPEGADEMQRMSKEP